jgi:Domain of unknown function (DUF6457)
MTEQPMTHPGGRSRRRLTVACSAQAYDAGAVTLHDWIDEICDVLDIDAEVDEGLVLDLARDAAHGVEEPAGPITTFLLGYAAALHDASPEKVEELAGRATALAEKWAGEDVTADDFDDVELDTDEDSELVDAD